MREFEVNKTVMQHHGCQLLHVTREFPFSKLISNQQLNLNFDITHRPSVGEPQVYTDFKQYILVSLRVTLSVLK